MNELGMQALIVDNVNQHDDGFARKLSHRFLVGVVDLLVKLPGYSAGVLEVKQRDMPKDENLAWRLEVTGPQQRFLRDADKADIPAGVASFTHRRGSGKLNKRLRLLVLTYSECLKWDWMVTARDHQYLGNGRDAPWSIEEHLTNWLNECERDANRRKSRGG